MAKRTKEYWREYSKKWREAKKNDPEYQEYIKAKKDDPEYREQRKAEAKRYYTKNKEKIREKTNAQYHDDPEYRNRRREEHKKWKARLKEDQLKALRKRSREYNAHRNANLTEEQKQKHREWERAYSKTETAKEKHRKKARKSYQTRTAWAIQMFGGKCMQCGIVDHPVVYDFHHVDPSTKLFDISKVISGIGIVRLIAELSKCVLLCTHCHRKITFGLDVLRCELKPIDWDVKLLKQYRRLQNLTIDILISN